MLRKLAIGLSTRGRQGLTFVDQILFAPVGNPDMKACMVSWATLSLGDST